MTVALSTVSEEIMTSRVSTFLIAAFFGIMFSLLFPEKKSIKQENSIKDNSAPTEVI